VRTQIYSDMLTLQARLQFPFERHFYSGPRWRGAKSVLDVGCGNGAYARILDKEFPGKSYVGVEQDPEMRSLASEISPQNYTVIGALEDLPPKTHFDFVLLRLVLLHVADRRLLFKSLLPHIHDNTSILIFDAFDDALSFDPEPKAFVEALAELRAQSKDRNLFDVLDAELAEIGFELREQDTIVVNSSFPHVSGDLFKYMYRTAELGIGRPLPQELDTELIQWVDQCPLCPVWLFWKTL
jgi:SAM-dependent methyltransferase